MAKRVFHFEWKGKPWKLHLVPANRMDGWAGQWQMDSLDGLTIWQDQEVMVNSTLQGEERLETVVHELLHVAFPGSSLKREKEVTEAAQLITEMLKRMELVNEG